MRLLRITLFVLFDILLLCGVAAAQDVSVRYQSQAISNRGLPLANQNVAVCTQPAVTTTQPCSPLATLATSTSTSSGGANPTTTDVNGNYFFYAAPGKYTVQVYGPQVQTPFVQPDVVLNFGPFTVQSLNGDIYQGGFSSFAAALAALPSGGTLRVGAGTFTLSATANLVTNLDIECSPNNTTTLQASASLNAPLFLASGINHATIRGCVIDGNRTNNSNTNDLVQITNSSHIVIDRNHLTNTLGNGVSLRTGSTWVEITGNEIERIGPLLPSQGTAVLWQAGAASPIFHIKVTDNRIHDGSLGIYVQPGATGTVTYDAEISHNRIYGMNQDGMAIFSVNSASFGQVKGIRFIDNDVECVGWPANGTGFDPFCVAGFLQTGSTGSSSGDGLDINSPNVEGITVVGNTFSHNFFEGVDVTPQTNTTVNTSGTTVTWVSGDNFNTNWAVNQGILVNGVFFTIASVAGAQTTLTLNTSAGTQTGVRLTGVGFVDPSAETATLSGNVACDNGHGNGATSGAGFADYGYRTAYNGNLACRNNAPGFSIGMGSFITYSGDRADGNNLSGSFNGNFLGQAALKPAYYGVHASGNAFGIVLAGSVNNAFISSPNLVGATSAVSDSGTADTFEQGSVIFNGTATLGTALINATTCATVVTQAATGAVTSDRVAWTFSAAPTGAYLTGLVVQAPYITAGNVNIFVCNPTAGNLTPPAASLNFSVIRIR